LCCAILVLISLMNFSAPSAEDTTALREKIDATLVKGADALWKLQGEDGGWHSRAYGHLKPGAALTAFVLETLATIDKDRHADDFERAEKFLIAAQGKDGGLGTKGEWLELPTYATAFAIQAFAKLKPEDWKDTIEPWVKYLKSAQHREENDCKAEELAYGGWGPEGVFVAGRGRGPTISSTCVAMEALAAVGALDRPTRDRAAQFVGKCHRWTVDEPHGGFFFTPITAELNKAGTHYLYDPQGGDRNGRYRAYGSATADGLCCLNLIYGRDILIQKAMSADARSGNYSGSTEKFTEFSTVWGWLVKHADSELVPGFEAKDAEGWAASMVFYYRANCSAALLIGSGAKMKPAVEADVWSKWAQWTLRAQQPEGHWQNSVNQMKEDDPLVATPLALKVLWNCKAAMVEKKP
jgi:prenyltransferase beta subunit